MHQSWWRSILNKTGFAYPEWPPIWLASHVHKEVGAGISAPPHKGAALRALPGPAPDPSRALLVCHCLKQSFGSLTLSTQYSQWRHRRKSHSALHLLVALRIAADLELISNPSSFHHLFQLLLGSVLKGRSDIRAP